MRADLVLEGGGVKGIGLVGAVSVLEEAGYEFARVAGTSAGAIVGALVAAGLSATQLHQIMSTLDYRRFRDPTPLARIPVAGPPLSILLRSGAYRGAVLERWLGKILEDNGVRTFGDLRLADEVGGLLPPEQRYRLVVMATDLAAGELVRLPWDYAARYGLDPDKQRVADAVRASMSIPFYFLPVKLMTQRGPTVLVDGGVLSNFPVEVFDRTDGKPPRWPTFGVKLSARADARQVPRPVHGTFGLGRALLAAMTSFYDNMHLDDPCVLARTLFVDTDKVSAVDFDLPLATQTRLYESGQASARRFLGGWSWMGYLARCRSDGGSEDPAGAVHRQ